MKLKIEYVPADSISPYENNAKIHTEEQIQQIVQSIQDFGFNDPIAVTGNTVVEGHGRLLAAQRLGLKEIPIVRLDHLTDSQRRAYTIVHNQLTMNTQNDMDILAEELERLSDEEIDMSVFGLELPEESVDSVNNQDNLYTENTDGGYVGDAVEATYKQINFRLYDPTRTEGQYNMPMLKPVDFIPDRMIGFNYAKTSKDYDSTLHFYIDDYQFERIWHRPLEYLPLMAKFRACLTPNFSIYLDYPEAAKIWNTWRGRLLGQVMQDYGIVTIPIVYWSTESSYNWAFDGLPEHSTLSINDFNRKNEESRELWDNGVKELIRRKSPERILLFGTTKEQKCDFDFGNIEVIYYQNENYKRIRGEE